MRKLLFAAALTAIIPFISKAQVQSGMYGYKAEDKYLYYSDVVHVDTSFTVNDLYKDAKLFITKLALTDTKLTTDDRAEGTVIAAIEEPATYKTESGIGNEPMTLKYNVKIELKKGRYRYTIDNIILTYVDQTGKNQDHSLYDIDKHKNGGLGFLGVSKDKRVLKSMDELFESKIELLKNTMKKRSDDF